MRPRAQRRPRRISGQNSSLFGAVHGRQGGKDPAWVFEEGESTGSIRAVDVPWAIGAPPRPQSHSVLLLPDRDSLGMMVACSAAHDIGCWQKQKLRRRRQENGLRKRAHRTRSVEANCCMHCDEAHRRPNAPRAAGSGRSLAVWHLHPSCRFRCRCHRRDPVIQAPSEVQAARSVFLLRSPPALP